MNIVFRPDFQGNSFSSQETPNLPPSFNYNLNSALPVAPRIVPSAVSVVPSKTVPLNFRPEAIPLSFSGKEPNPAPEFNYDLNDISPVTDKVTFPKNQSTNIAPTLTTAPDNIKPKDPHNSTPTNPTGLTNIFFKNLFSWTGGIPLQHFWVVKFNYNENFKKTFINYGASILSGGGDGCRWDNYNVNYIMKDLINSDSLQGTSIVGTDQFLQTGCYFARSVSVPGERVDSISVNAPSTGGLYFPPMLNKRQAPGSLRISFMETNASFVDLFLRPWVIMSSYLGSIGRNQTTSNYDNTLKLGTVEAIYYSKNQKINSNNGSEFVAVSQSTSNQNYSKDFTPIVRKKFTFKGVSPLSLASQENTHTGETLTLVPVDFIYDSYKVDTYYS